jgi:RNA polymerase sigma-70 factor (ECF subfamily)
MDLESRIAAHLGRGDRGAAARTLIEAYGTGILGYLRALLDEDDAQDVYSEFQERILLGLPAFRWECAVRTWAYQVARNAVRHWARDGYRRRRGRLGTSTASRIPARSSTPSRKEAERREQLAALKRLLSPDDITLLVLRVDRGMSWNEVAAVLSAGGRPSPATVRKRFERLTARLKEQARAAGLVD